MSHHVTPFSLQSSFSKRSTNLRGWRPSGPVESLLDTWFLVQMLLSHSATNMHAPMHVVELILMHKETCWNDSVINSIAIYRMMVYKACNSTFFVIYMIGLYQLQPRPRAVGPSTSQPWRILSGNPLSTKYRNKSTAQIGLHHPQNYFLYIHWESRGVNLIDRTFQEKNSDCQHLFSTFNHLYVIQIWSRLETQPLSNPASVCDLKPFLLLTSATQNCKHQYPSGACENVTEVTEVTNPLVWW